MVNEVLTNEDDLISESKLDSLITQIETVKFEDYTALDVVELLAICFVPFLILIVSYGMMRVLSMRVNRL